MMASYQGKSDMAVANMVGSNLLNITLVLSLIFFLAKKLSPERNLFALDSAWILAPVAIFLMMIFDSEISRFDGVLLVSMMVAYLIFLLNGAKEELEIDVSLKKEAFRWGRSIALLTVGFILTIGGANFVVESGSNIARLFGVSEWIIGLFLIALGTSLPELVVSIVAVRKGNADMSIGNIIGSNVANFSMVLGGASILAPLHINLATSTFDIALMVVASLILMLILANKLYNRAGAVLLFILLGLFVQNTLSAL
jgi:cation:H+ antiporter